MDLVARSLLFVPGHRGRMVEKALAMRELDVAMLDLEDGVPEAEKDAARRLVATTIERPGSGPLRFVRVHRALTDAFMEDLAAAVRPGAFALVLPKVERAEEVALAGDLLVDVERERGLPPLRLVPSIESARGLLHAAEIAAASSRIAGLMFGGEDYANDLGLPEQRTGLDRELLYARSAVVVAAVAAGVPAWDSVWTDIADLDGLARDAAQARRLGFSGRTCIHPSHVATIDGAFTPTDGEAERARRLLAAFEEGERGGVGAVSFEGQMVDRPVVERARRILRSWERSHPSDGLARI